MPTIYNIPYNGQYNGIAGSGSVTIVPAPGPLFTADLPQRFTDSVVFPAGFVAQAFTPIAIDPTSKAIVVAAPGTPAIGITASDVGVMSDPNTFSALTVDTAFPVIRGGCLNPDMINWPSAYADDASKKSAFAGAPSPTQIIVQARGDYIPADPD